MLKIEKFRICLAGNDSSIVDHVISAVRKKPSTRLWVCTPQFFEIDKLKSSSSMAASRRNTRKRVRPESKLYPIEYRKEIKRFTQHFPNLTSLGCGSGLLTSSDQNECASCGNAPALASLGLLKSCQNPSVQALFAEYLIFL